MKFLQVHMGLLPLAIHPDSLIGSYWNWFKAMDGDVCEIAKPPESFDNYDVIMVGLAKYELIHCTVSRIRNQIGNNTRLIVAIDYAVQLWGDMFSLHQLRQELLQADMVIASDKFQQDALYALLNSTVPVEVVPPPTNIERVIPFMTPLSDRDNTIGVNIHKYDFNWLYPYLVCRKLPYQKTAYLGAKEHEAPQMVMEVKPYFDSYRVAMGTAAYIKEIGGRRAVLDSYHNINTYGRPAVECACLELPSVGSSATDAQKILWPSLTTEPGDLKGQYDILEQLMTDQTFYNCAVDHARKEVKQYGYAGRKAALLSKLDLM